MNTSITLVQRYIDGDERRVTIESNNIRWPEIICDCFDALRGMGFGIPMNNEEILDMLDELQSEHASTIIGGYDGV